MQEDAEDEAGTRRKRKPRKEQGGRQSPPHAPGRPNGKGEGERPQGEEGRGAEGNGDRGRGGEGNGHGSGGGRSAEAKHD